MFMFDTNAMSAVVHRAKGFERIAERVTELSYRERLLSAISLSELQTMIEKAAQPRAKRAKVWQILIHFWFLRLSSSRTFSPKRGSIRTRLGMPSCGAKKAIGGSIPTAARV